MPFADPATRRAYQRDWARARRAELTAGLACALCGSSADGIELHHVDPASKTSHRITTWSRQRRDAEAAKCVPLCRDCHRGIHAAERQRHGRSAYQRRGCRCDVCRAAKAEANRRALARRAAG